MAGALFRLGLLGLVASCGGCGGARQNLVGYPLHHQRVSILIKISDQVNAADDDGGVATLAETVSAGLKENGIDSQIYASKYDEAPPPRIELNVLYWHGTSAVSHKWAAASVVVPLAGVGALATAGNHMVVDCSVFVPDKSVPVYEHRFDRFRMGTPMAGTSDLAAASSAGEAIVSAVLTAKQTRDDEGQLLEDTPDSPPPAASVDVGEQP